MKSELSIRGGTALRPSFTSFRTFADRSIHGGDSIPSTLGDAVRFRAAHAVSGHCGVPAATVPHRPPRRSTISCGCLTRSAAEFLPPLPVLCGTLGEGWGEGHSYRALKTLTPRPLPEDRERGMVVRRSHHRRIGRQFRDSAFDMNRAGQTIDTDWRNPIVNQIAQGTGNKKEYRCEPPQTAQMPGDAQSGRRAREATGIFDKDKGAERIGGQSKSFERCLACR